MLLAVDIGNTNITLGIFNNDTLVNVLRVETDKNNTKNAYLKTFQQIQKNYNIDGCIIASVADELTLTIKKVCTTVFNTIPIMVNNQIQTENVLDFSKFSTLGADRIANAYSAYKQYPLPAIVVDCGTAITFEIISSNCKYVGGIIMPGLELQLKALHLYTSKLPKIEIQPIKQVIGSDTKNCILSGIINGTANAISGLIEQCKTELGENATVIATGGYAEVISKYLPQQFDYVNKNLTLEGLKLLYNSNI